MPWPRLTQTLPHERKIGYCQACGSREETPTLWEEFDDQDQPQGVYLELCDNCNETKDFAGKPARRNTKRTMIVRHERMYSNVAKHAWLPGLMHLCVDCVFAKNLECTNPLKGGGLNIAGPKPFTFHIKAGRGKSGWYTSYQPAESCSGFSDGKVLLVVTNPEHSQQLEGHGDLSPRLEVGIGPIEVWGSEQ